MRTERIKYIDTLRGFAIFLVTLGHVLENCGYHKGILFQIIYSFHMPLFFCISGFVMSFSFERKISTVERIKIKDVAKFIFARFKSIMVPYYSWSLIALPLFFYCYNNTINYKAILDSVFVTNTSFWFLPCLFGLSIIYILYKYLLHKIPCKNRNTLYKFVISMLLTATLFTLSHITKYDFLRSIISYILPFAIGIIMSEYKNINIIVCNNSVLYSVCLLSFCFCVGMFITPPTPLLGKLARLICGIISIPVLFNLFKNINLRPSINEAIQYTGKNTLIIYILQFGFLHNMFEINGLNFFLQLCLFSAISILLILLILLISRFFEHNNFLSIIFLGKKKS